MKADIYQVNLPLRAPKIEKKHAGHYEQLTKLSVKMQYVFYFANSAAST